MSLGIVPSIPITIGITVTFMCHSFCSSLVRSKYFSLFIFFDFYCGLLRWQSLLSDRFSFFFSFFFFLLNTIRSGLLVGIWWFVSVTKLQRILCILFSRMDSGLCIQHLVVLSNFNFLNNSLWITFPTQLCLVLFSFCADLLNGFISYHINNTCYFVATYLFSLCHKDYVIVLYSYEKKFSFLVSHS